MLPWNYPLEDMGWVWLVHLIGTWVSSAEVFRDYQLPLSGKSKGTGQDYMLFCPFLLPPHRAIRLFFQVVPLCEGSSEHAALTFYRQLNCVIWFPLSLHSTPLVPTVCNTSWRVCEGKKKNKNESIWRTRFLFNNLTSQKGGSWKDRPRANKNIAPLN